MDEDDSQDELINRNTSHSKGKRALAWAISDDSDDDQQESEGESNSGEDDGEEEEEDEEEANEDNDDEDEEEDEKAEDGAFGGAAADLAEMSSDEDSDKCPICLNSFTSQPVATPENCEHYFCLDCILEWTNNANSCPIDRIAFNSIYLRKSYGGNVKKMITIQKPVKSPEEIIDVDLEQTNCEVCGGSDREDRLLLCDGCDAGYHMECLTPPLDSVPVEEWFCPECEANNRHSTEELNDRESLPSTARHASRRHQAAGRTRAIARTQQSERVRANVNRHRISQARTSQLAPTYLIQSTWLDETINAVIAGLNSSVYVRDLTPRATQSHRGRRRTVKRRKTSSSVGKKGKAAGKGVKRKKRRGRRTKSRKNLMLNKTVTPRNRIAKSLGIVKDRKNSSLPTVYRPSEQTLSGMRADIGAASLSIYGDPFDLDPFIDHAEEEQQAHASSLLEAKRRGISRSALRSHQPVARPVTASLSRRGIGVPQSRAVVESAPVPDLLGSILSGQSMLMMDSSDVVINRDGSLKATKPIMPAIVNPGCGKSSIVNDACPQISPAMSPNQADSYNPIQPPPAHPRWKPPCPGRPANPSTHRGTNELPIHPSSMHAPPDSRSNSSGIPSALLKCKKSPTKPMWVDVSVLPRIPKIKKEGSSITNGVSSSSSSSSHIYNVPERGMNSFGGDKGKQQSVEQRKGRAAGETQSSRSDTAGSSSTFSSSFSTSAGFAGNQPHQSASSSSSSAVSFRINSSGNLWHSRRLSMGSSTSSGGSMQEVWKEKKEEARKKQLRRDKQMLLASRTLGNKEEDGDSIYDPFNPTQSDSSSSEDEAESRRLGSSSQNTAHDRRAASWGGDAVSMEADVKEETHELVISEDELSRSSLQGIMSKVRCSKVEKGSRPVDDETEKQTPCDHKVKDETVELNKSHVYPTTSPNFENDPSASAKKTEKAKTPCSKTPSRDLSQKKVFHSLKEQHTSSSETDRGGRLDHYSSDHAFKEKEKKRDGKHSCGHSRARKRKSARSSSERSLSNSPDRTHGRHSRSRSGDRRHSRSSSSSGSRECLKRKKHKHRSMEGLEGRDRESEKRRTAKENRRGRSRSKSSSRSRSRSMERRKDETRLQKSASTSRHKGEPTSKPNRKRRSRSRSRERRKEEGSSKSSQKTSSFCVPASKDVKQVQAKKKEDITSNILKEDPVIKQEAQRESQAPTSATAKKRLLIEDIKKEKQPSFDMFEELAGTKPVKKEESDLCVVTAAKNEEGYTGFKTEACEISVIKSEASSPEFCPSVTSVSPLLKPGGLQDSLDQPQPDLLGPAAQPNAADLTAAVKEEQPSDSDDDFNIDVMLDSLQYEKPENTEETVSDQQGKEGAVEDMSTSNSLSTKSKNQVKRVTWNIQEPEGPQPEKSPSKLALYKLKLKQEGLRRPSAIGQNSSQDSAVSVGDLSKRSHVGTVSSLSRSDGSVSQKLSATEQGAEDDLSRKDKYLKKLHMQERAVEEVKLAIKPFYQNRDINKDEYKEILRKAVQKVCHSKSGEINPVKVGNLVKAYVDKYKHARKHKKGEEASRMQKVHTEVPKPSGSP
ncbi:PHD and RING finger domain-containing protein 1 [Takifugu flavidus]|uniref:PHD and RING finger domain-containing protein 1 n=1 Tax=Takifugu flavidus TaxID=433684 RepID=A0A5C6P9V2_9TELE|nr:PHD and RING finger domain-containing protein 1 [Takifugu flavidus]TWW75601.1 PHD and RING finger domain-containing protein 1 [Takifugu flavidus]